MTDSTIDSGNKVIQFASKVRRAYVREGVFGKYIGDNENSIIQTNKSLQKKSLPLVGKLSGTGVRGSSSLTGSEEALSNYAQTFQPTYLRNAVVIDREERDSSAFDLFMSARPSLMNWLMETKRDQIIQALGGLEAGGAYYNYGGTAASGSTGSTAASAANMDTWLTANVDRVLYGSAKANTTSGDHTTSLGTIDTTNDKVSTSSLELLKRLAADADPLIRPVTLNGDEPFYVYFVGKYGFRDLRNDSAMQAANRDAMQRGKTNPLFSGGDLLWDNILIKEVPDLDKFIDSTGSGLWDGVWGANATGDNLATSGAASSRVGVGFLCGAQAITFGRGRDAMFIKGKEDDYGHTDGVAVSAKHDIKKTFYNGKQHGIITHFHSAVLDA